MPRQITPATSLENLKKEAKRWLKQLEAHDAEARARFDRAYPAAPHRPVLRDVQHALAREHGRENWNALKQAVAQRPVESSVPASLGRSIDDFDRLANDMILAFNSHDGAALQRLNERYQRSFTFDDLSAEVWRRVYAFRQRSSKVPKNFLEPSEAQMLIAQDAGFGSWAALTRALATGASPVPPYLIDTPEDRIGPRRLLSGSEWDELIGVMKERRITRFHAAGMVTDATLARIAELEQVTALCLGGSRGLTDDGLLHLARMPQLEYLDLSGGKLTDRGLDALRHLPNLRTFEMTWQSGITDAGVANLRFCDRLEHVDLMGTLTGDGAVEALQGKPKLRYFSSGRLVTDRGLLRLHNFPMLKTWSTCATPASGATDVIADATHLLIDGPFTDDGLASLAGLEGVFELDLFWHVTGITAEGFAHLVDVPNLGSLGADGELSNNVAMRHIAAMPRLRPLRAQGTVATDDGFESLSRSRTIEYIWGRECPNLTGRGHRVVEDAAARSRGQLVRGRRGASSCHAFRAPRVTPIDVTDDGVTSAAASGSNV